MEKARALISYLEVTWHFKLTKKLFSAKISERATLQNLWRQMVTVHLPANVDRSRDFVHEKVFLPGLYNKRMSMFPLALPQEAEILGKQN